MNNFIKWLIDLWTETGEYVENQSSKPDIKICRDCKYCVQGNNPYGRYDKCTHPKTQGEPNLVTGKIQQLAYCTIERSYLGSCEVSGRYWTPKTDEKT
jgi:hypothetical protein